MIDPAQPIPIFVQLKALLLNDILRGRFNAGDRLPTEHDLCAMYGISRTPVTRALSELADEGVGLRHRRRGTFVNPHWIKRNANSREVRVMVPEGPWARLLEAAAGDDLSLNIVTVELTDLHQQLVHAVAAGHAPDVAVLDSVWVPEFAAAGFSPIVGADRSRYRRLCPRLYRRSNCAIRGVHHH
jgi:DNA-binding GntR family transcriptional regulator